MPFGFTTETVTVAGEAIRAPGTTAVNCVEETKVVERRSPFHNTAEAGSNPDPVTVRVKSLPPATAEAGLMEVTAGGGAVMVNVRALDEAPPGFRTVTAALPDAAMEEAAT
jgi:hypothetical protein